MLDDLSTDFLNTKYSDINFKNYLSTGGQKKVYVANIDSKEVVVKFLPVDSVSTSKRAEREINCMKKVNSQNLVTLMKCFEDEIDEKKVIVLIEEYIPGCSLREIIEKKPSLELAIDVLETLLNLLIKFDENNIIHRDIKPENIIISDTRGVVLLDFGVARVLDETNITATFLPRAPGTIAYSSPEQLQNLRDKMNIRSDLFSCGIVFFEVATGSHPFEQDESETLYESILEGNRKTLSEFFPKSQLTKMLGEIYIKLTNTYPHERYRKPEFALEMLYKVKEALKNGG